MRRFVFFVVLFSHILPLRAQEEPAVEGSESFGTLEAYIPYFEQATGFGLAFARYRERGYEARFQSQWLDGFSAADPARGGVAWNLFGGLSGVGIERNDPGFRYPLSVIDRSLSAWEQTPGGRISLGGANRNYNGRPGITRASRPRRDGPTPCTAAARGAMRCRSREPGTTLGPSTARFRNGLATATDWVFRCFLPLSNGPCSRRRRPRLFR